MCCCSNWEVLTVMSQRDLNLCACLLPDNVDTKEFICPTAQLIPLSFSVAPLDYNNGGFYFTYESLDKLGNGIFATNIPIGAVMYVVCCKESHDLWLCLSEQILDANFLYRGDLDIYALMDYKNLVDILYVLIGKYATGREFSKVCYILDNPVAEEYTPYSNPSYPYNKYKKKTPIGMQVLRFDNRFDRDVVIAELEKKYRDKPAKSAAELVSKELNQNAAIIVSDGATSFGASMSAYWYLDSDKLEHNCIAFKPSVVEQGSLLGEIVAATRALKTCYDNNKTVIDYYYDNKAIVNILNSKRLSDIPEIMEYKELCEKLHEEGFIVTYKELHPKRGSHRNNSNPALLYFHNSCDKACTDIANLYRSKCTQVAASDTSTGVKYSDTVKPKKRKTKNCNKQ